jgi:hypothetical protein
MTESTVTLTTRHFSPGWDLLTLWVGVLLPPVAWFLSQQISYVLVPWACATGRQFALLLVDLAMILLAGTGGVMAWRSWQRTSQDHGDEAGSMLLRSRFIALAGLLSSGIFVLAILAQAMPSFILSACEP